MKTITFIRHAKSSWELDVDDFDRPLNHRGFEDIALVAKSYTPFLLMQDKILCSPAKRATTTAVFLFQNVTISSEKIEYLKDLYTFDCYQLEEIVKSVSNSVKNLLIFGHNAAITDFVNKFGDKTIANVPTTGLVSIVFEISDWKELKQGKTLRFLTPKDFK